MPFRLGYVWMHVYLEIFMPFYSEQVALHLRGGVRKTQTSTLEEVWKLLLRFNGFL
jgi:hypothetical protein